MPSNSARRISGSSFGEAVATGPMGLAPGALSPERAKREVERWVEQQVQERMSQLATAIPVAGASDPSLHPGQALVDLDIFNAA